MTSLTGILRFEDIGPGIWILETDNGKRYQLQGPVVEHYADRKVIVSGTLSAEASFGMVGNDILLLSALQIKD